jgi:hypothetical protein
MGDEAPGGEAGRRLVGRAIQVKGFRHAARRSGIVVESGPAADIGREER